MQDEKSLLLRAPKESQNMRTAERGITQSVHKFSFSKVLQLGCLKLCIHGTNNMIILHHIFVFIYIYITVFSSMERSLALRPRNSSFTKTQ